MSESNNRIGELAEAAYRDVACNDTTGDTVCREAVDRKFAELIIEECAKACEPRPWVGLTDDEFDSINPRLSLFQFYEAIEAKLKELNERL